MYILLDMKTKVTKWGNSLGVRLPKAITDQKSLQDGSRVLVSLKDNQIVIEPVTAEVTLDSLLKEITKTNLHNESDWLGSTTVGKEIW